MNTKPIIIKDVISKDVRELLCYLLSPEIGFEGAYLNTYVRNAKIPRYRKRGEDPNISIDLLYNEGLDFQHNCYNIIIPLSQASADKFQEAWQTYCKELGKEKSYLFNAVMSLSSSFACENTPHIFMNFNCLTKSEIYDMSAMLSDLKYSLKTIINDERPKNAIAI